MNFNLSLACSFATSPLGPLRILYSPSRPTPIPTLGAQQRSTLCGMKNFFAVPQVVRKSSRLRQSSIPTSTLTMTPFSIWVSMPRRRWCSSDFWWHHVHKFVAAFVRTLDACQRSKPLTAYRSNPLLPLTSLFETFYIDFAGPLPFTAGGHRFLLVFL